ncbi:MAG: hypothetical protein ACI4ET_13355 [Bilifractor sp.]
MVHGDVFSRSALERAGILKQCGQSGMCESTDPEDTETAQSTTTARAPERFDDSERLLVMFSYRKRDPLTDNAAVTVIGSAACMRSSLLPHW